jgi:hypothetical protein
MPLVKRSDDPTGRIATIQQHQIVRSEIRQIVEPHLPLTDRGGIEFETEGQFGSGQIESDRPAPKAQFLNLRGLILLGPYHTESAATEIASLVAYLFDRVD